MDEDEGYDEFLSMLASAPPSSASHEKAVMENEGPPKETASRNEGDSIDFRKSMARKHQDRNKSTLVGLTDDDHDSPPSSRLFNNQSRVLDHYSLPTPSSTMKFRSANVHVYDSQGSQLILEERLTTRNNSAHLGKTASLGLDANVEQEHVSTSTATNVTVKRIVNVSPELLFLRGLYSTVAFFLGGDCLVFAVGLLLFLVSDLAEQARIILYGVGDHKGKQRNYISYEHYLI